MVGKVKGETRRIEWDNGELSGDPLAVNAVEGWANRVWYPVGPVGGLHTRENHLQSALSTRIIIEKVFDTIEATSGDFPKIPSVPDGAEA